MYLYDINMQLITAFIYKTTCTLYMRLHDKQLYDVIENHFEASGMSQTLRKAAK